MSLPYSIVIFKIFRNIGFSCNHGDFPDLLWPIIYSQRCSDGAGNSDVLIGDIGGGYHTPMYETVT